jgi:hypothetical protein
MQTIEHTSARDTAEAGGPAAVCRSLRDLADATDRVLAAICAAIDDTDGGRVGMPVAGDLLGTADRVTAAALEVLMSVSYRGVLADEGVTTGTYLRMHADRTIADEKMLGNAAEALADMPALRRWLRDGDVSWAVVRGVVAGTRNLTRAQRRWVDDTLAGDVERVRGLGADELVGAVEHLANEARPDLHRGRQQRAFDRRRVTVQPRLDGTGGRLDADLDAEGFSSVVNALDSYHADCPDHDHDDDDEEELEFGPRQRWRRGIGRRRADALVGMANHRNADVCPANRHHHCRHTDPAGDTSGAEHTDATGAPADASSDTGSTGDPDTAADTGADPDTADDAEPAVADTADDAAADRAADAGDAGNDAAGGCGPDAGWAPSQATPSLLLIADLAVLAGDDRLRGIAELLTRMTSGPVEVTGAMLERAMCDGSWQLVFTHGCEILGVSAKPPKVSARLRAAVIARDGACRFPSCREPAQLCDIHHVISVVDDGPTVLENLALICPQHHHAIHDGEWAGTLHPDGTMTFTRRGVTTTSLPRALRYFTPDTPPPRGRPSRRHRQRGSPPTHTPPTAASDDDLPF